MTSDKKVLLNSITKTFRRTWDNLYLKFASSDKLSHSKVPTP